ncbi:putative E3 ubiquitin-protein ligase UBR7 [Panonychus citri]|uniref:putative E3 ubiquitin-protein ligase UBR7 n=1 Tax=Panonychus citri TaxID=50023 RepID=UPI002307E5AA|nr:putative E3 ubiquitin-protein ligase UBR7 [Panonychus citri]
MSGSEKLSSIGMVSSPPAAEVNGSVKREEIIVVNDLPGCESGLPVEEDCENVITMMDVLEEEKQLEDDAFAVLGGSDEKDCTYLRGYVTRQALYACNTCRSNSGEPNGICLACSYACHEGHDLYELYTKRSFRCDCGNSRMTGGTKCNLCPTKSPSNPDNVYNHNFSGLYCVCDRPYPDPENDDPMYQCIVCEDWFHDAHLESEIPEEKGFAEMVCSHCMAKLDFLWYYFKDTFRVNEESSQLNQQQPQPMPSSSQEDQKSVEFLPISSQSSSSSSSSSNILPSSASLSSLSTPSSSQPSSSSSSFSSAQNSTNEKEKKSNSSLGNTDISSDSGIESSCDSVVAVNSNECKLESLKSKISIDGLKGSSFWEEGWRSALCKCPLCLAKYSSLGCGFICDEKDTVSFYEKQGKEKSIQISQYERGLNEINKMDRVTTIEAIQQCNFMADELKNYLKKFVDNNKVVRREDIDEFFAGLAARKRVRNDNYGY